MFEYQRDRTNGSLSLFPTTPDKRSQHSHRQRALMSAYYIPNQAVSVSSPIKIRQEGFQVPSTGSPSLNAPPSPTAQYDPQNSFFAGSHGVFPNAFKKLNDRNSIDFTDTLASILAPDSSDDLHLHRSNPHFPPSGLHTQQQNHQSNDLASTSASNPSQYFDISSFPSQFASFNRGGPATSGTIDLNSSSLHDSPSAGMPSNNTSAGSLGHHFISGDPSLSFHPQNGTPHLPPPTTHQRAHTISFPNTTSGMRPVLPRLNSVRTSSPASTQTALGTTSDPRHNMGMVVPSSPYDPFPPTNTGAAVGIPPHIANAVGMNAPSGRTAPGVQPSSGAVRRNSSRSRSRSRPATSGAVSASGVAVPGSSAGGGIGGSSSGGRASSRVGKRRTQSISSPSPPAGTTASSVASNAPVNGGAGSIAIAGPGRPGPMSILIPEVPNHINHIRHGSQGQALVSPSNTAASASWMFSPGSAQTAYSLPNGHNMGGAGDVGSSLGAASSYISQSVPPNGIIVDDDRTPPTKEDPSTKQSVSFSLTSCLCSRVWFCPAFLSHTYHHSFISNVYVGLRY